MTRFDPPSSAAWQPMQPSQPNSFVSQALIEEIGQDISRLATLIGEPISPANRCSVSSYYIQAVVTGHGVFLTTNLPQINSTHVTEVASTWLIGRDSTCAIAIPHRLVSRCQAVLSYRPSSGFTIMDVGSTNGTFVNRRRLQVQEARPLRDGDLLEFSSVAVEFFISGNLESAPTPSLQDTFA